MGIEIDGDCVNYLKSRGRNIVCGDIAGTLPFKDNAFRWVVAHDVLEHFEIEDAKKLLILIYLEKETNSHKVMEKSSWDLSRVRAAIQILEDEGWIARPTRRLDGALTDLKCSTEGKKKLNTMTKRNSDGKNSLVQINIGSIFKGEINIDSLFKGSLF